VQRGEPLGQLALEKLTRVLGPAHGKRAYDETMAALSLTEIATPDDLYRFGDHLYTQGGFHAAVGGLLTVAAVLRGARRG
jgi:hypothetical protein